MICKISLDKTEKVRYNIGNVKYQNGNGSPHRKPTGGSVKTCYHIITSHNERKLKEHGGTIWVFFQELAMS